MDKISVQRVQLLHPSLRVEALQILAEADEALTGRASLRYAHTTRTFAEQDKLFAQRPKVTNARGGQSWHNYGLAIDIVLLLDGGKTASWDMKTDFDGDKQADWMEVVKIFKKYGWAWGGDWKNFPDAPHFEKIPAGLDLKTALARYQGKIFVPQEQYIKL